MSVDTLSTARRWRSLVTVTTSAMAVAMAIGMAAPMLSLMLERRGVDTATNGLNAAIPALAIFVAGPLVPRVIAGLGLKATLIGGAVAGVGSVLAMAVFDEPAAWFVLRFLFGLGMALQWVASETWVNAAVTDDMRGKAIGLYATLWGVGVAIGPQVMRLTGIDGMAPFLACAGLLALALVPLLLARGLTPVLPERPAVTSLRPVFRRAPLVLGAAFVCGFAETNAFALLPLFGLRLGFDEASAVLIMTVTAVGGLALQPPLGWLADRVGRTRLLAACAAVGCACALALPPLVTGWPVALWPILFVWGGAVAGLYTLGLILIGQTFAREDLPGANAAFIMSYTVGMVVGPVVGGAAMDAWDPYGIMAVLAIVFGAYYVLAMFSMRRSKMRRSKMAR